MGIFDEFKRLAHPYEDEDDYEDFEFSSRPEESRRRSSNGFSTDKAFHRDYGSYDFPTNDNSYRSNKVFNIQATTQVKVVLARPERFEDVAPIADHLREMHTVVLNLESTDGAIARRLLDFLAGVSYANDSRIKRVASSTYIITPYNVDILGDLIDELENNGLYF